MLYFHCYNKEIVLEAFQLVQASVGDADAALQDLGEQLFGPLNAGSLAPEKNEIPKLLRLLSLRKEVQQLFPWDEQAPLVLVFEDASEVPGEFSDLGPTFEMFGSSLSEVEVEAGEVGFIPPKLDLQSAFGLIEQGAETAAWF